MRLFSGAVVSLLLLSGSARTDHQTPATGVIGGVVQDQTRHFLTGARVSIPGLTRRVTVDREGRFFFRGLRPGVYTLVTTRDKFGADTLEVTVAGGDSVIRTIQLTWDVPSPVLRENDAVPYVGPFPAAVPVGPADSAAGRLGRAVGAVTTCEGKPLGGAMVLDLPGGRTGQATSEQRGFALMPRAPGTYSFRVRLLGYLPETLSWKARKGRVDTLQSALTKQTFTLCQCFVPYEGRLLPNYRHCDCQTPRCRQPKAR